MLIVLSLIFTYSMQPNTSKAAVNQLFQLAYNTKKA